MLKVTETINQYKYTDKAIQLLNRKAIKRFKKTQKECSMLEWDELNVLNKCKNLYKQLEKDNIKTYAELADIVYRKTIDNFDLRESIKTEYDSEIWESWIIKNILSVPDEVTHYIYSNEVMRKAERTAEAINSTNKKIGELQKGLRLWAKQTKQYADTITTEVVIKAYKDAGIKKVKWNTIIDGRECNICHNRNGKIYPIDNVPPKAHYGDRCWLTPVL